MRHELLLELCACLHSQGFLCFERMGDLVILVNHSFTAALIHDGMGAAIVPDFV